MEAAVKCVIETAKQLGLKQVRILIRADSSEKLAKWKKYERRYTGSRRALINRGCRLCASADRQQHGGFCKRFCTH
ncbi:hypothetical protein KKH56_02895 [bacterium]|nr:hypothetical protein [bacterium]